MVVDMRGRAIVDAGGSGKAMGGLGLREGEMKVVSCPGFFKGRLG